MKAYVNCITSGAELRSDIKVLIPEMNLRRRMSRVVKSGVAAGIETFRYHCIYPGLLTLHSKTGRRNDMNNRNSTLFQPSCPCFRIPGRSKNNLHSLFYHNIHDFFYLRIHQRNVHTKRKLCSYTAFANMLA